MSRWPHRDGSDSSTWDLFTSMGNRSSGIGRYHGMSSLRGWVRVIVARMIVDELRRVAARPSERAAELGAIGPRAALDDPECALFEHCVRDPIAAAITTTFEALPARERRLLRLRVLEHMTTAQLAAVFGVHRTTVARWIEQTYALIRSQTYAALENELGLPTNDLAGMLASMHGRVDVSVHGVLSSTP